ncbi:MAG: hypothetical protein LBQ24_06945 [Candidatus Peribacteria bacterium]|nr:hypothetical protein [Candidatus Peribacteria bacterium]
MVCDTLFAWDGDSCEENKPEANNPPNSVTSCNGRYRVKMNGTYTWRSYGAEWAITNPIWDSSSKSRTFVRGTVEDYPAFKACNDL